MTHSEPLRLAILADFTAGLLQRALRKVLPADSTVASFGGDFHATLLNPDAGLTAFAPNRVLIAVSGPAQWERQLTAPAPAAQPYMELVEHELPRCWALIRAQMPGARIWQSTLTPWHDGLPPLRGCAGTSAAIQAANVALRARIDAEADVACLDWELLLSAAGTDANYDPRLWLTAGHPFALDCLPALAASCKRHYAQEAGRIPKAVVVDLDNTLWGGVIGDVGVEGIELGTDAHGRVFWVFQQWLKALRQRGLLLAIASHNEQAAAMAAFAHPMMVLRPADFAAMQVNWEPKSVQLAAIARQLNIHADALVFLDDNPSVRGEVAAQIPEVCVPALSDDPAQWLPFLAAQHYFDGVVSDALAVDRTAHFQGEARRAATRPRFASYAEWLDSLEMRGQVAPLHNANLARALQLVQRTNQFNLRPLRHSEATLRARMDDPRWMCRLYGLRDSFGDCGLVSFLMVALPETQDTDTATLDAWLLSCRVFQRRFEDWILQQLAAECAAKKIRYLTTTLIATERNAQLPERLTALGWQALDGQQWRLDLQSLPSQRLPINDT